MFQVSKHPVQTQRHFLYTPCSAVQRNVYIPLSVGSAVQCTSVLFNSLHISVVQCGAVQCSAVQCSTVQCSLMMCSTEQYSVVQCSLVLYSGCCRYLLWASNVANLHFRNLSALNYITNICWFFFRGDSSKDIKTGNIQYI